MLSRKARWHMSAQAHKARYGTWTRKAHKARWYVSTSGTQFSRLKNNIFKIPKMLRNTNRLHRCKNPNYQSQQLLSRPKCVSKLPKVALVQLTFGWSRLTYSDLGWSRMSLTYNFCKNYTHIFFVGDQIFENYFSDSFYYYYKSWQLLFSKIGTAFCISNRDRDITNWFSYFKSGQIYYKQGSFYKSVTHI